MLTLIAAMSTNRIIGTNNTLPRDIPADLKRFRDLTRGHIVVMGRKTYESIGRLLPKRENHIISSALQLHDIHNTDPDTSARVFETIEERLYRYEANNDKHIYIIGGGEIYRQFLEFADDIELTLIHTTLDGDVSFPVFEDHFTEDNKESHQDDHYHYDFIHYVRK
jgi:dihydrofolate reductase